MAKAAEANIIEFDTEAIRAREAEVAQETDDQIIERIRKRFTTLNEMTKAVKDGHVRSLIVTGPPGVGKSYGVEDVLSREFANSRNRFEIVEGRITALSLYTKLWEYKDAGNVLVFDDCDDIYFDNHSLALLKASMDSSPQRWIGWHSDNRLLRIEDIPSRFEFRGGAIFITNVKFSLVRSKKLREHLNALEDRSHYLDLEIDTLREKLLRIRQTVTDGMLRDFGLTPEAEAEILQFINDNAEKLRHVSQRTVRKIGELRKGFPQTWKDKAAETCMVRVKK